MAKDKLRRPREEVAPIVAALTEDLNVNCGYRNKEWHFGGSWRRNAPTIGDLDVVVFTPSGTFEDLYMPYLFKVERKGDNITAGSWTAPGHDPIHLDIWACKPEYRGCFLCFITGPADLNIAMRRKAIDMGMTLGQYTLTLANDPEARMDFNSEISVFSALGMPWMRPEDRQKYAAGAPQDAINFKVKSETSNGLEYNVKLTDGDTWSCTCRAYKYSKTFPPTCKHIIRVQEGRQQ